MAQGKTPPAAKTTGPAKKARAQEPPAEAKASAAKRSGEAKGATKTPARSTAGAEAPSTARPTPKAQGAVKTIKVTQIRSGIGFDRKQTLALRGLGLRRIRHSVEVADTPGARGLILKVRHLVTVTE